MQAKQVCSTTEHHVSSHFLIVIAVSMNWYLIVTFIQVSLMIGGVECHSMSLLTISVSSLEKYLFESFAVFESA